MDINRVPGSKIVEIARIAFATPGIDFLCFGESDQPSPTVARDAAIASLMAGETRYADVPGSPAVREALSEYLSGLYPKPVPSTRIQVTASGITPVGVARSPLCAGGDAV